MKVAGQALLHAPIDQVWAALNDPAVLVRAIPGCQRMEATGPDSYQLTVLAGVASIRGSYSATVALAELDQPHSFLLRASGAGGPGTVQADIRIELAEAGGNTELNYAADAMVGGMIGGVGQRMLVGVARKLAGEFFSTVDDLLTGVSPQLPAATSAELPAGLADGEPAVFTGSLGPTPAVAGPQFVFGALFGAAAALLGVLVGIRAGRCARRS